jgi:hypothetical protein
VPCGSDSYDGAQKRKHFGRFHGQYPAKVPVNGALLTGAVVVLLPQPAADKTSNTERAARTFVAIEKR